MTDAVRAEAIRTLYVQIRNAFAAAMVVTVYMAVTAWPYNPHQVVVAWAAVQLSTQLLRLVLVRAYRRAAPPDEALPRWAALVTAYMALAGLVWGATAFLFIHLDEPITLALTLCGLYGITGGSVPGNAYNPPGLYAFVGLIFAGVFAKLASQPTAGHIALAIASAMYALILFGFCRVQAASVAESLRVRFENLDLLEQLRQQTAEAEAARRKAEQASLAKSQFLAAASHDLRQPLYALSLFSSSLEGLRLPKEGRAVVGRIQANIEALEGLFSGLLDISRLEAGVITPAREPVSVAAVFARLDGLFRPLAAEKGLRLLFHGVGWVDTDPVLFEQVLANLIGNALRYTTAGGVLVAARPRGGRLRFEVWDTGCGIAEADLQRIFDDFVQLGNPERDRRKGMGLGLTICRRAVGLLEAEIEVRSTPGRGSRFAFVQPAAEPASAAPLPAAVSLTDDPLTGLKLLFVDDDPDVREGLVRLARGWGVEVDDVADAEAALRRVGEGGRYRAVLCDYRLGAGLDGLTLVQRLTQADPGLCAWLVTGDLDPALIARAQAAGVPLLHKPLKAAQLRALLAHAASTGPRRRAPVKA